LLCISLCSNFGYKLCFLGLYRHNEGATGANVFYCEDMTDTGYDSSWNSGEPNDWGDGEDCTTMYASVYQMEDTARLPGLWNDVECNAVSGPCMCQYCREGTYANGMVCSTCPAGFYCPIAVAVQLWDDNYSYRPITGRRHIEIVSKFISILSPRSF
jgi:hypothetical protein